MTIVTTTGIISVFSVLALSIALTAAPQVSQPSFNCARASTPSEHAICADPRLGRLDRRLADRYVAVRQAMTPALREALTRDQRWFLGARDEWQENSTRGGFRDFPDLAARMTDRIAFLDQLRTRPATHLQGTWRNAAGTVEIRTLEKGQMSVEINAAHPVNARWLCDISGRARLGESTIVIDADDGWRIRLSLDRGSLKVEELAPGGQGGSRPYCGMNGHVDGTYFLTR
jgi:uncharacterized protein